MQERYSKLEGGDTGKGASVMEDAFLKKARELLQTTGLNVSEVAYDVGFKDLSCFSKCFFEEYGE